MEFWRIVLENPSDEKSKNDLAIAIDKIPKIVFSHMLKNVEWASARLAAQAIEKEILELKQQSGKNILIGSRSLIIQQMNLNLVDEYQLCVHPVIIGKGLPLFDEIKDRTVLKLIKTKPFNSGAIVMYYEPKKE